MFIFLAASAQSTHLQGMRRIGDLGRIGCAPWLIRLLRSPEFEPAATRLQRQTVGNVFKLACLSMGFAFVAMARSSIAFYSKLLCNVFFLPIIWVGLPLSGHVPLAVGLLLLARAAPLAGAGASVLLGLVTNRLSGYVVLANIGPDGRLVSKLPSSTR